MAFGGRVPTEPARQPRHAYAWRRDHHHPGTRVPPPPSRHDGLPDPFRATGDARALAWGVGTTDRVVRLEEVGATGPPAVAELPRSHFVGVVFRQVVPHHNECAGRKLKALLVRWNHTPEEIGHRPSSQGEETRLAQGYMRRDLTPILPTRQPEDPVPQGLPPGNGRVTTRYHPTGSALSKWRFSCLP